jgi:hypothetical protein
MQVLKQFKIAMGQHNAVDCFIFMCASVITYKLEMGKA